MNRKTASYVIAILAASTVLSITSCGSDSTGPVPETDTQVSGVVVKGPVSAAMVEIRTLTGDGSPGELVADPVMTDASGAWSALIPATQAGTHFLVVASGGSYIDEASPTASPVDLPANAELIGYFERARPSSVAITPYTKLLHHMAREGVAELGSARAWQKAIESTSAANSFGFDLTATIPSHAPGATADQLEYSALLGGLSVMAQQEPAYAGLQAANRFDLVDAIVQDLGDGSLDGRNAAGDAINVPLTPGGTGSEPLPLISATGINPLSDYTRQYTDGTPGFESFEAPGSFAIVPIGPDTIDCATFEQFRGAAFASLENAFFASLNGPDPQAPRDIDFGATRSLYLQMFECDSTDPEVNLALALLDMATLAVDPDVNDAFDEWDAYLDAIVPFEADASAARLSAPAGLSNPGEAMDLPFDAVLRSLLPHLRLDRTVAPPQIANVQEIFQNVVLPRVLSAIAHMDAVLMEPGFMFHISPRMQGDLLEETREADATDFFALRAGLNALEAGILVAVAYQVNLPEYTGNQLLASLSQDTGDLLRLREGGATQLQMVPGLLRNAADDLDAAISALFAETDVQTDDLIKIGPRDLDGANLLSFQSVELPIIRQSLEGPVTRSYNWDFESGTPDREMTIDINGFFASPVTDLKSLLPPYSISLDVVPYNTQRMSEDSTVAVEVNVPQGGNISYSCFVGYDGFEATDSQCSVPAWAAVALGNLVDSEVARIQLIPGWSGDLWVMAAIYGSFDAGLQNINAGVYANYSITETFVEVGVITFAADTYGEWLAQWPDPTLGGLFPDVTVAADVVDSFGMVESSWSKRFHLNWVVGQFGFEYMPEPPIGPISEARRRR